MTETLIWVAIALPSLLILQRWIHRHLRGLTYLLTGRMDWSVLLYALILFPGVLLHELSHWVTARLLGVRTGAISLIPQLQSDGKLQLGYVEYYKGRTLDPLRESLIGGAPLITGTALLLLIGFRVFNVGDVGTGMAASLAAGQVQGVVTALGALFATPDFLIWLYLIFAISNAMMPSPSDRRAWPAFLALLAALAVILIVLDLQEWLLAGLAQPAAAISGYLGLALSLAVAVDLAFIILIYSLEAIISRIRGVELVYEQAER